MKVEDLVYNEKSRFVAMPLDLDLRTYFLTKCTVLKSWSSADKAQTARTLFTSCGPQCTCSCVKCDSKRVRRSEMSLSA